MIGYVSYNAHDKKFKYIYNYTDHLGNIRVSYTENDNPNLLPIMIEENHYYPFGLKHKKYGMADAVPALAFNYKYNGKEYQDELGLNLYDFHFRQYMQDLGRTTTLDPLAEMFYSQSPYSFLNNNPLSFVDPTGMASDDWRIHYTDMKGKSQVFLFNGGDTPLPDSQFVQDFVETYKYNVGNGGGDSMKTIAESSDIIVDVVETSGLSKNENYSHPTNGYNIVTWNPSIGLETSNGTILSPATILEHEADHALGFAKNPTKQKSLFQAFDKKYDNKEEKRVIIGTEQKTARANGEIFGQSVTRENHKGLPVITNSPTSTKINNTKTYNYLRNFSNKYSVSFPGFSIEKYNTKK